MKMFWAVFSGVATVASAYLSYLAFDGRMEPWVAGMGWVIVTGWNGISFVQDTMKLKEEDKND